MNRKPRVFFNSKITVSGEAAELNGPDTREDILHGPLLSEDVEKLEAGRADVGASSNGIRGFVSVQRDVKLWINKIGMVG